jgi:hypothetical protein
MILPLSLVRRGPNMSGARSVKMCSVISGVPCCYQTLQIGDFFTRQPARFRINQLRTV